MKVFNSQEILFSIIWASSLMMLITSLMLLVKLLPEPRVKETKKAVSKKQAYDTYHRGIEDFNKQSYTNAAKLLFDAFSMFENIGDFNLAGHSLIYLAEIEKLNQNNRLARSDLNLAIAYFQKGSNQRGLGKALLKLGNLAYSERKETLANTYYQEALSLLNITADELEVANCLYGLGLVATDKHLDELALNYFLKSLLLGKKHNALLASEINGGIGLQ